MEWNESLIKVLYVALIFLAGFVTAYALGDFSAGGITGSAINLPSDFVENHQIIVYPDEVVLKIGGAKVTNYDSTGSMLPTLGRGVNGIAVVPESPDEINIGDIVSYWSGEKLIVHRIVEKGVDSEGIYFITKGDNNGFSDGKVRFEEIEHVLVGVID